MSRSISKYPSHLERDLANSLRQLVREVTKIVHQELDDLLPVVVSAHRHDDDQSNDAGYLSAFLAAMARIRTRLGKVLQPYFSKLQRLAGQVNDLNKRQFQTQVKRKFGFGIAAPESKIQAELRAFTANNRDLLSSIPSQQLEAVQQELVAGIKAGMAADQLKKLITKVNSVAERRAVNIAKDQVSDLNGELTKLRQIDFGIESYIWRGCLDSRERQTHLDREGVEFRWDDPPPGGHPGEDYNCRCAAQPVFPNSIVQLRPGLAILG